MVIFLYSGRLIPHLPHLEQHRPTSLLPFICQITASPRTNGSACSKARRYCTARPSGEGSAEENSSEGSAEKSAAGGGDEGGDRVGGGGGEGEGEGAAGGKAVADNTAPVGNNADHMVSAVAGNGQVVARAVTARNLLQVRQLNIPYRYYYRHVRKYVRLHVYIYPFCLFYCFFPQHVYMYIPLLSFLLFFS